MIDKPPGCILPLLDRSVPRGQYLQTNHMHPVPLALTRRTAILAMIGAASAARAQSGAREALWKDWTDHFLAPDGRVVDAGQGGISHSEGQGYGLILAQALGDRDAFERIEGWTRQHLAIRPDTLTVWRWDPVTGPDRSGETATDGDLFRAWALLRAVRDSGWLGHEGTAREIARDLVRLCIVPDPRAPDEPLLRPGAQSRAGKRVLWNPSYLMPRALIELGTAFDLPDLVRAADHGADVLAELAATGLLPDWIDVTKDGFAPAPDRALQWGHDALRIQLYLLWSGRDHHPALGLADATFGKAPAPGHVATVVAPDGTVGAQSDYAGFLAIAALGSCAPRTRARRAGQPYYPATLELLAHVARREGACRTPGGHRPNPTPP